MGSPSCPLTAPTPYVYTLANRDSQMSLLLRRAASWRIMVSRKSTLADPFTRFFISTAFLGPAQAVLTCWRVAGCTKGRVQGRHPNSARNLRYKTSLSLPPPPPPPPKEPTVSNHGIFANKPSLTYTTRTSHWTSPFVPPSPRSVLQEVKQQSETQHRKQTTSWGYVVELNDAVCLGLTD